MDRKTAAILMFALLAACSGGQPAQQAAAPAPPPGPAPGSNEWKIQSAMSAGPAEIARAAAIMDYPTTPTGQPTQIRAGTNGWTCLPDMPDTPDPDPICVDGQWMNWFGAWMGHKSPHTTAVGLSYMLMGADDASNTDAFKMKPDSGQQWIHSGPHMMIISPGNNYAGLPTTPQANMPFVMFAGTPYAHIMAPVPAPASHTM
ncbi:MAG TPA: hypothetical protein VGI92_13275 [Gemmatimonadales bacterium]|jgi:hypothetical protein